MKRFGWMILGCACFQLLSAQSVRLRDLTDLLDVNRNKLETHLHKKGFKRSGFFTGEEDYYFKTKQTKAGNIVQRFQVIREGQDIDLVYQTTSLQEFSTLENEIQGFGFTQYRDSNNLNPMLYQKQNLVLKCSFQKEDTSLFYEVRASKKIIPKLKDIVFAEDLLQLTSHEFIVEAFGRQNVKKDIFYLTPTETKKCTVIFPNTNRQAIFLWKDENNLRDISFIIVGEQLNNDGKNLNAVSLSNWRSNQGIYCGMSLKEIQNLNKEPISFYNWRTESAGFIGPKNKGEIDFNKLKPVFNCMNCSFLNVDSNLDIIQSSNAIDENQKVYVVSFVIMPEKKTEIDRLTSIK